MIIGPSVRMVVSAGFGATWARARPGASAETSERGRKNDRKRKEGITALLREGVVHLDAWLYGSDRPAPVTGL